MLLSGVTAFNFASLTALVLFLPSRRTRELIQAAFYDRDTLGARFGCWLFGGASSSTGNHGQ